jgi:hypothetical protein
LIHPGVQLGLSLLTKRAEGGRDHELDRVRVRSDVLSRGDMDDRHPAGRRADRQRVEYLGRLAGAALGRGVDSSGTRSLGDGGARFFGSGGVLRGWGIGWISLTTPFPLLVVAARVVVRLYEDVIDVVDAWE